MNWDIAVREALAWCAGDVRLERPSGTLLHQLMEAWEADELLHPKEHLDYKNHFRSVLNFNFHVFVVEHDWASAFTNNSDIVDANQGFDQSRFDFKTPYDNCCFEFKISGKHVCLLTRFDGEMNGYVVSAFLKTSAGWLQIVLNDHRSMRVNRFLNGQFRAIGIALDAAAVETAVVRAPEKLNRARARRGKLPLYDYRIVDLSKRRRPATLPDGDGVTERNGVRLHFRRGHWRHFETFKTWINWMLVGNPDLGFIDKHYRA